MKRGIGKVQNTQTFDNPDQQVDLASKIEKYTWNIFLLCYQCGTSC